MIAYSANYDGNTDIYVVSSEGGVPRRITHHPDADLTDETVASWISGVTGIPLPSDGLPARG